MTITTDDRCMLEKNKKIFATRAVAEDFEKRNREAHNLTQQYAYDCPYDNHVHLSSSPSRDAGVGAPQLKMTDWSQSKAWHVVDPELRTTRSEKILVALRKYNGSKTVKEIAAECALADNQIGAIYNIAKENNLPYLVKRSFGRMAQQPPVITLQNVLSRREQIEAELKLLDDQEKTIREREEAKIRVTVKVAENGHNGETMIFAGASGNAVWLTAEQADSLLAQLPAVIDFMKGSASGAGAVGV